MSELSDMEKRQMKVATRQLLDEFPSLQEAAKLCRMGATRLSQYQYFDAPAFMPIDGPSFGAKRVGHVETILSMAGS